MPLVKNIELLSAPPGSLSEQHRHDLSQLLYVTRGELTIEILGSRERCIAPSVVFIGNCEPHIIISASEDYERYVISVDPHEAEHALSPVWLASVFTRRPLGFSHVLSVSGIENEINVLVAMLCRAGGEEERSLALSAFLYRLSEHSPEHFRSESRGSGELTVASVRADIERDFRSKLSLDTLAKRYRVSRFYLAHIFKSITGHSLKDHLMSCRISYACQLLSESRLSIAQIAEESGFRDVSNFSRSFRERISLSPSEFRQRSQGDGK